MKKRILAVIVIVTMISNIAGCGAKTEKQVDESGITEESSVVESDETRTTIQLEEDIEQSTIAAEPEVDRFTQLPEISMLKTGELKVGRNPNWIDNRPNDEFSTDFFYRTYDSADSLQQDYPYYILKLDDSQLNDTIKFDVGVIDNDIAKVCYTDDTYSFYLEIITNPTMNVEEWYTDLTKPVILQGDDDVELYYAESEDGYIKRGSFRINNMIYTISTMGMTQESMLYYVASLFV